MGTGRLDGAARARPAGHESGPGRARPVCRVDTGRCDLAGGVRPDALGQHPRSSSRGEHSGPNLDAPLPGATRMGSGNVDTGGSGGLRLRAWAARQPGYTGCAGYPRRPAPGPGAGDGCVGRAFLPVSKGPAGQTLFPGGDYYPAVRPCLAVALVAPAGEPRSKAQG